MWYCTGCGYRTNSAERAQEHEISHGHSTRLGEAKS